MPLTQRPSSRRCCPPALPIASKARRPKPWPSIAARRSERPGTAVGLKDNARAPPAAGSPAFCTYGRRTSGPCCRPASYRLRRNRRGARILVQGSYAGGEAVLQGHVPGQGEILEAVGIDHRSDGTRRHVSEEDEPGQQSERPNPDRRTQPLGAGPHQSPRERGGRFSRKARTPST